MAEAEEYEFAARLNIRESRYRGYGRAFQTQLPLARRPTNCDFSACICVAGLFFYVYGNLDERPYFPPDQPLSPSVCRHLIPQSSYHAVQFEIGEAGNVPSRVQSLLFEPIPFQRRPYGLSFRGPVSPGTVSRTRPSLSLSRPRSRDRASTSAAADLPPTSRSSLLFEPIPFQRRPYGVSFRGPFPLSRPRSRDRASTSAAADLPTTSSAAADLPTTSSAAADLPTTSRSSPTLTRSIDRASTSAAGDLPAISRSSLTHTEEQLDEAPDVFGWQMGDTLMGIAYRVPLENAENAVGPESAVGPENAGDLRMQ